jgi:hypothetical protein
MGYKNDTGIICNDYCTEGTLNVSRGYYSIDAKIVVNDAAGPGIWVTCYLATDGGSRDFAEGTDGDTQTLTMSAVAAVSGNVTVVCKDRDLGDVRGSNLRIKAVRLGAISIVAIS